MYFNPRSPWGERHLGGVQLRFTGLFQSTLPVGGATWAESASRKNNRDFNPRSPWGERRVVEIGKGAASPISIHAPRGGSDSKDAQIFL